MIRYRRYNVWYRDRKSMKSRKQLGPWRVWANSEGDRKPLTLAAAKEISFNLTTYQKQITQIVPAEAFVTVRDWA